MPDYELHALVGFVVDPDENIRRLLRSLLRQLGLATILEFPDTAAAAKGLHTVAPDYMLIDIDFADGEGARFIADLRQGEQGENPFLCLLGTSWTPTAATMLRLAYSGADGLIAKPFSPKQVHERILGLIGARKPFVVTADYLGPDLRRVAADGLPASPVVVPNIMAMKAGRRYKPDEAAREIARAKQQVRMQRLARLGMQVAFLLELAAPGLSKDPRDRTALDQLARLPTIISDLVGRLPEGSQARTAVVGLVQDIWRALDPADRVQGDAHAAIVLRARQAGLAIACLAGGRVDVAAVEHKIAAAVAHQRSPSDPIPPSMDPSRPAAAH